MKAYWVVSKMRNIITSNGKEKSINQIITNPKN